MAAVGYRLRAELRSRWRVWLALAAVVGLVAGAVLAIVAGARRTQSAYPRFLQAQRAYDVAVVNYPADGTATFDFDELARLPQVAEAAWGSFEWVGLGPGAGAVASADGRIGTDINRFKLLEGRRADPTRPDEVVVSFDAAERHGLELGSKISFIPPDVLEPLRHALAGDLDQLPPDLRADFEGLPAEELARIEDVLRVMPDGAFRVVGIEASPGEFPPQFAGNYLAVHATPAAHRLGVLGDGENAMLFLRLKEGADGVAAFERELDRRAGGRPFSTLVQADHAQVVQRSIDHQATALWVLAGLLAVAAVLVVGQTLARQAFLEASEHPSLRAVGMSRAQLFALGVSRASLIGVAAGVVALPVAVAASPLFPQGLARIAETSSGVRVDALAVVPGAAATVAAVALLGAVPAWRRARVATEVGTADRPGADASRLATAAAKAGLPPVAVAGTRMALERGRGASAVPVGTSVAAVTLGVAVLVGALTFWGSLQHLRDTPELYGLRWDIEAATVETWDEGGGDHAPEGEAPSDADGPSEGPSVTEAVPAVLAAHPDVEAFGMGGAGDVGLRLEGLRVDVLALDSIDGDILPPIVEGQPPTAPAEIVVGKKTLRRLGVEVGDEVEASLAGVGTSHRLRIVGTAVLPTLSEAARLGEGVLATTALVGLFDPEEFDNPAWYIRLAPGVDPEAVTAELQEQLGPLYVLPRGEPTDLVNFGRIESLPLAVGLVLALMAAATLTHVLVTSVRRRRRDLAVLKSLGFTRRQVAFSVMWQATSFAGVALALGVPLGLVVGRWSWRAFADQLGVVAQPVTPVTSLLLTLVAAALLANAAAAVPARAAVRTRPALVLRTE